MVKSLYTLRLSSGYNDLLNSENLKVAIAQLTWDLPFQLKWSEGQLQNFPPCPPIQNFQI